MRYVARRRLLKAAQELAQTKQGILEIALLCNCGNLFHIFSQFICHRLRALRHKIPKRSVTHCLILNTFMKLSCFLRCFQLSELIFQDMRSNAKQRIQNAVEKGSVAARAITTAQEDLTNKADAPYRGLNMCILR